MQKWTADRLRLKQGRAYSVEREVHVADEKEPDVRLRAKASDASVPLEVKVAETWTLPELDAALGQINRRSPIEKATSPLNLILYFTDIQETAGELDVLQRALEEATPYRQ